MDTYRRAAKEFTERVRGLSVADLARSTPCQGQGQGQEQGQGQGWSVADILRHVIQDHEESLGAAPTEVGGDGLVARWHSTTRAYAAAIASDRAPSSPVAEGGPSPRIAPTKRATDRSYMFSCVMGTSSSRPSRLSVTVPIGCWVMTSLA
jgi:hypothetical protein